MIVIVHSPGHLGNRLFLFAHFIAFCMEHGHTVVNLSFDPYAKYFEATYQSRLCSYPTNSIVERLVKPISWFINAGSDTESRQKLRRAFARLTWIAYRTSARVKCQRFVRPLSDEGLTHLWDMSAVDFVNLAERTNVLVTCGWLFRDHSALQKHTDAIRKLFIPISPHRSRVDATVDHARANADLLVGVHIRRGDYRTFLNGRFFFEFDQYAELMRKVSSMLGHHNRVAFFICSDELVPMDRFCGLNIFLGTGHLIEDMYALAKCDLLIGPQSTFSGWASFYGSVPWCLIEHPQADPRPESFRSFHEVWDYSIHDQVYTK